MKSVSTRKKPRPSDEMRREYRFDYAKAKPNRFSGKMKQGTIAVVLDPDVAAIFETSESVNTLLRSVITAMKARPVK